MQREKDMLAEPQAFRVPGDKRWGTAMGTGIHRVLPNMLRSLNSTLKGIQGQVQEGLKSDCNMIYFVIERYACVHRGGLIRDHMIMIKDQEFC